MQKLLDIGENVKEIEETYHKRDKRINRLIGKLDVDACFLVLIKLRTFFQNQ
ncbi:hypothetical protein [Myroides indicus]|uniref:Uncharacterized protein n=1 Tax=Myroides indicus TaxID=1323422 RepID=A0A4R7EQU7_9FLAO|nr:hypothetical protein [Myroides indicus]TDS55256.1 hypothetical protein C8P70_12327 [Myroides indicus]